MTSVSDATGYTLYVFDGENRLVEVRPNSPALGQKRVTMAYDFMGRRIKKDVYVWTADAGTGTTSWTLDTARTFTWDGWLMTDETATTSTPNAQPETTSYVWGLDLSQTLTGAGGVGGVIAAAQNGQANYFFYDVNGNVNQLADASGAIVAQYQYDPYGKLIFAGGAGATENTIRFSTKYWDNESGLGYWGYRFYSSDSGRWISRDPLGEDGGHNLHVFVAGNSINHYDILGLIINSKVCLDEYLKRNLVSNWNSTRVLSSRSNSKDGSKYFPYSGISSYKSNNIVSEILSTMINSRRNFLFNTFEELFIHINARKNIVGLTKSQNFKLAIGGNFKVSDPTLWQKNQDVYSAQHIIPNRKKMDEAFKELFNHSEKYTIGCTDANYYILRYGVYLASGDYEYYKIDENIFDRTDWIPGDAGYIRNLRSDWAPGVYAGQNIIYIGNKSFWGLTSDKSTQVKTLKDWMDTVDSWEFNIGNPQLEDYRVRPKTYKSE